MKALGDVIRIDALPPDAGVPPPLERHYSVKSASALIEQTGPWWWREIRAGRIRVVRIKSIGDPKRWSVRIPESEIRKLLLEAPR